ncbi:phage tail sheath subtilisin-like domain-containing protein [Streptomyces sp. NBC_00536]|uniref:phage tail sheath family protein n=1 Tax=Streptomyces sp. NBC_00536 TaxID=2975769 RepID=UPI002E811DC0|nr:phage tail sheath C-terminal domain-containing protein [Streptomyces sp. NBC_00536]WUC82460.1 phage tail sheath subtilisin-like domain-containing protein [Streptomyces sp. NBC_00536]
MSSGQLAPGVFVKELPSGVRTITGAGTSTPAFLGYTVRAPNDVGSTPPTLIRSWTEFVDAFHFRSALTPEAVAAELDRVGAAVVEQSGELTTAEGVLHTKATTGETPDLTEPEFQRLLDVRTREWEGESVSDADKAAAAALVLKISLAAAEYARWNTAGEQLAPLLRREAELTVVQGHQEAAKVIHLPESVYGFFANGGTSCYVLRLDRGQDIQAAVEGDAARRTGLAGLKSVPEVTMVAVPDLWTGGTADALGGTVIGRVAGHCASMGNRLALVEPPPGKSASTVKAFLDHLASPDTDDAAFTTLYYPWLDVPGVDGTPRTVPPSGHIAGIWARTDAERGVFKAPANQNIRGALTIPTLLTDDQHGELNNKGVNCLRVFPDRGLLVWGARTRSTSRDWKYLNVRRLVSHLSDSIRQSSTWAVFEPNDDRLWATLRHSTTSFLTDQWRQGALLGRTPDEAFYVICDTTNNTPTTIDDGKVICDIGIAPVRPAEFVHFTLTQTAGETGK